MRIIIEAPHIKNTKLGKLFDNYGIKMFVRENGNLGYSKRFIATLEIDMSNVWFVDDEGDEYTIYGEGSSYTSAIDNCFERHQKEFDQRPINFYHTYQGERILQRIYQENLP